MSRGSDGWKSKFTSECVAKASASAVSFSG
jgi:hypothetical protein